MLNININTLTNSLTFYHDEWAESHYLERDTEESIDDAIRRIIPEAMADGNEGDSCRSTEQIEQFIRNFRNLGDGDEVDYSALVEDWPTALNAKRFYTQVQEAEESRLQECHRRPDLKDYGPCAWELYEDAMQEYEDAIDEGVEDETNWIVLLVTHLEMWLAEKALRSLLVVGELIRLHDKDDRALIGVFIGRLEVLVDGCVYDLAVDSVKIEEKLSLLSLAA